MVLKRSLVVCCLLLLLPKVLMAQAVPPPIPPPPPPGLPIDQGVYILLGMALIYGVIQIKKAEF
ncbi:MAG: hypothetical protein JXR05_10270 [Flavobacteriaceae bacterium]